MAIGIAQSILYIVVTAILWNSMQGMFQLAFNKYERSKQIAIYIAMMVVTIAILAMRKEIDSVF